MLGYKWCGWLVGHTFQIMNTVLEGPCINNGNQYIALLSRLQASLECVLLSFCILFEKINLGIQGFIGCADCFDTFGGFVQLGGRCLKLRCYVINFFLGTSEFFISSNNCILIFGMFSFFFFFYSFQIGFPLRACRKSFAIIHFGTDNLT
jgi:hypothetical protein